MMFANCASNDKPCATVRTPIGDLVAYYTGDFENYPGFDICLLRDGIELPLARAEYDAENETLNVFAWEPHYDEPATTLRIPKADIERLFREDNE